MSRLSLLYKIAIESYVNVLYSNKEIFTKEGFTTKDGKNISLMNSINEDKIYDVIKTLNDICDDAKREYGIERKVSTELNELSISGNFGNFKSFRVHNETRSESTSVYSIKDDVVVNLYAVDLFSPLTINGDRKRVPILFALINDNNVPSVLLIENSFKLFDAYKSEFSYKTFPLSEGLLDDIFNYIVDGNTLSSRDCLLISTYNALDATGNEFKTFTVSTESMSKYTNILGNTGYDTNIINQVRGIDPMSMPLIKFDDDMSSGELKIKSLLASNKFNLLDDITFDEYTSSNGEYNLVVLQSEGSRNLIIDGYSNEEIDSRNYSVNGRMYTVEKEEFYETEDGSYDTRLVYSAESLGFISENVGALELLPYSEKAHSFEDTYTSSIIYKAKEFIKSVKEIAKFEKGVYKNSRDKVDYIRSLDSKIDQAFKIMIGISVGTVTGMLVGPIVGAAITLLTIREMQHSGDSNKKADDIQVIYNKNIKLLTNKLSEAKAEGDTKRAMKIEKTINLLNTRIEKSKLAKILRIENKRIQKKYKK